MRQVFQTKFGYPTGNCFGAAVASIFDLDSIPDVEPSLPHNEWVKEWAKVFTEIGVIWENQSSEPEGNNWDWFPPDVYAIANVAVGPGIGHSVVFYNGVPVHDVAPGSPFLRLTGEQQRKFRILSWAWFPPLGEATSSTAHWEGAENIPNWVEAER